MENGRKDKFIERDFTTNNSKIKLPSGEVISHRELDESLSHYITQSPSIIDIDNSTNKVEKKYKVISRKRYIYNPIFALIAAGIIAITGFGISRELDTKGIELKNKIEYTVNQVDYRERLETSQEAYDRLFDVIETNQKLKISTGVKYYDKSDYEITKHKTGTIGSKIRQAGYYNIDYISVLYNGRILEVTYDGGKDLNEYLDELSKKYNIRLDDLEPVVHLGGEISGWVSLKDLADNQGMKEKKIDVLLDEKDRYSGVDKKFDGQYITIKKDKERVDLAITNEEGNLLEDGTIVTGSDGNDYRILDLNQDKNTLTWSLSDINKEVALAASALAAILTRLKRKKEFKYRILTESEIKEIIYLAKRNFETEKEFIKASKKVAHKTSTSMIDAEKHLESSLIARQSSIEEIKGMGR